MRPGLPGRERRARSPLGVVFVTVFVDLVGFGIVIPLLPLYAQEFGAGPVAAAWLVAVYSLMQFFFAPGWGRLSDRIGRRPVLLVGLFASAASYALTALAPSLAVLFAARALSGVAGANVGVAQAYVADVTGPAERAKGMGMIGAAFGLGFILGPAIGGALAHLGHAAPFYGAAALALVNGLVALVRLPESLPPERRAGIPPSPGLFERLAALFGGGVSPALRALYAAGFAVTLAFAALEGTLSLWADRRWSLTPPQVALLFVWLGVVAVVAQGVAVGRLARRYGERATAAAGAAAMGVGLAALALAPSLPTLALALAVLAFGQGTSVPAISSLVSQRGGPAEQGKLLGLQQSLSALGRVAGPVAGGFALAHLGLGAPYLVGAALGGAALVLLAWAARPAGAA